MKVIRKSLLLGVALVLSSCSFFDWISPKKEDPSNFSVSFNANGGKGKMEKMSTSGSTFVAPLCKFTYENHSFEKWALNSTKGKQYSVGETIKNITKNITLYAVWSKQAVTNFTVSFNANGGTGTMASQQTNGSEFVTPSTTTFTHEGYTFSGWGLNSSIGTQYQPGAKITGITEDITLFALWEENAPSGTKEEFAQAFQDLKTSILTHHNYTVTIHSYLEGYEDDPDCVFDDEFVMIDDKIIYRDNGLFGGVEGVISQKNQGFVNFEYYGMNVLADGFYSTRTDVGISELRDDVAENFFIGSVTQDNNNIAKFISTNTDVMAVAANMVWDYPELLSNTESVYFVVGENKDKLTLNTAFTYWNFDEGEELMVLKSTFEIHDIGSTTNAGLESYVENPTETYSTPTDWTSDQKTLFGTRYAGTYPTFIENLSYSLDVFENLDKSDGKYKVLVQDFGSGDRRSEYASQLVNNELFSEYPSESSRLLKRVDIDAVNLRKTTYVVEMFYIAPTEEVSFGLVSRRYPAGIFQVYFHALIENTTVNTIQLLNEYISVKGYDQFVPQFNIDPTIAVSNFEDITETENTKAGEHRYEFYTSSKFLRIVIPSLSDAKTAMASYVTTIKGAGYGFTGEQHNAMFQQVIYTNSERYKYDSTITMTDLDTFTDSNYPGYVQIQYKVYAEKDESDVPHVVGLSIGGSIRTEFAVGDTFEYGGTLKAELSSGNNIPLTEEDVVFDQYDLSVSGDQTVRVSYTCDGITNSKYYDIHVASNRNFTCEFDYAGVHNILNINLCDDGTGTYTNTRPTEKATAYFTYVISGDSITFTLTRCESFSAFYSYSLFPSTTIGTTNTATYNSTENKIEATVTNTYGNNPSNRVFLGTAS